MHTKNIHKNGYDLEVLSINNPNLKPFVILKNDKHTIDFSNPKAVRELNSALLKTYYNIAFWHFPEQNLTPAIPSRAEYIHLINDLIQTSKITEKVNVLDIGTGANCIYPLLGQAIYNWIFTATDVCNTSLKYAKSIIAKNKLNRQISILKQNNRSSIFKGILDADSKFTVAMCNPPFYKNETEANQATLQKQIGLKQPANSVSRNFAGQATELWYNGGEKAFLHNFLYESSLFKTQCSWYTILVSNKANLKSMYASLEKLEAKQIKTLPIQIGNKKSRVVAWTFLEIN